MAFFKDIAQLIDPNRVVAVVTIADIYKLQDMTAEPGDPAHPAVLALWQLGGQQSETGLRDVIQSTVDTFSDRQPEDAPVITDDQRNQVGAVFSISDVIALKHLIRTGADERAVRAIDEQVGVQKRMGLTAIVQKAYATFLERLRALDSLPDDSLRN